LESTRLAAVRLFVRDLNEAIAFYAKHFEWKPAAGGASQGYCVFDVGGIDLVVETVAHDASEEDQALVGRFSGLSFQVADVATTYERMRSNGVVFSGEPEKQFWGGTLATLLDPAGNGIQLVERPRK
jgi:predicted enzyme related to lactoylglutathione lyase